MHIAGYYWIDPNEGCFSDAEYVYCDFENKRACVQPKKENVRCNFQCFLDFVYDCGEQFSTETFLYPITKSLH